MKWELNYLEQTEKLIPVYCYISLSQDREKLGDSATDFLVKVASEYYLTGGVTQTVKTINGDREIQDFTENVLDDHVQLFANQNLIILVCHRIEILSSLDNTEHAIDRITLNQLVKLLSKVKGKCPLMLYPLTPLKKLKIKAARSALNRTVGGSTSIKINLEDVDAEEVRSVLQHIRT